MPIKNNNKDIQRIKYIDENNQEQDIKRVYKGNDLQWALFDIEYNYDKANGGTCSETPNSYVWGGEDIYLPSCSHTSVSYPREDAYGFNDTGYGDPIPCGVGCDGWVTSADPTVGTPIIKIDGNSSESDKVYQRLIQCKYKYKYTWGVDWDS